MHTRRTLFADIKGIAQPAQRALSGAGYSYLEELVSVTEAALKNLHGMGPKALGILKTQLGSQGLDFKR